MKWMDRQLEQFFEEQLPFPKQGLEELMSAFQLNEYARGQYLLHSDHTDRYIRIIVEGYVREYVTGDDEEVNVNFYGPGEVATDFLSFQSGKIAGKWLKTLTAVKLYSLPKSVFSELLAKYDAEKTVMEEAFQSILTCKQQKHHNLLTQSPEIRYRNLLTEHPGWLQNIPQYHIASFLQVKPETLSRIRKRI